MTERRFMFNKSQEKAISHKEGPALVLAGPGTGKTTVITQRINRLMKDGVCGENILVVTFTRMAAKEMKERFAKISHEGEEKVTFGTFHSIFLRTLRRSCAFGKIDVLSEKERNEILTEIVIGSKIRNFDLKEFVKDISSEISRLKGNAIAVKDFRSQYCATEDFEKIYLGYNREMRARNLVDYDDILVMCRELLANDESVRSWCQEKYQYILVDEFQDINYLQYDILKMMVGSANNIFAVGDDDQSIYGFRGANPDIMFRFKKDFKNTRVINLNVNYRSCAEITECAGKLILNNSHRYKKQVTSFRNDSGRVNIINVSSRSEEYEFIEKCIRRMLDEGEQPENIAVLFRNNWDIANLENYLNEYNITSCAKRKRTIFSHQIAKNVVLYMKAAMSNQEMPIFFNEALAAIINKPERMVSRHIILESECNLTQLKKIYSGAFDIKKNITKLQNDLMMIKKMEPYAAINYIQFGVGYGEEGEKKQEQIFAQLKRESLKFKTKEQFIDFAEKNRFDKAADKEKKKNGGEQVGGVNLLTMHSSKGLEFKHVILPDICQGIIPEARAIREEDIDEERRLMYVAMTRAVCSLHIISPTHFCGKIMNRSQFVDEMVSEK